MDRKAREQEGYVEEFQRVYDQGLTDAEKHKQEETSGKAQENLSNNAYNTAAIDAGATTGNVEIARITRMSDPYKRMGAARAYASRLHRMTLLSYKSISAMKLKRMVVL